MPDNKDTIYFAGRNIDRKEFVRRAQEKAGAWMNYQGLQGDERSDFVNSFNDILQGIVDGRYTVSEFGKIQGLSNDTDYQYKQHNGERAEGKPTIFSSRRRGFNPNQNVETFLNGIANAISENSSETSTKKGKKWNKSMMYNRITTSIFGEGNVPNQTDLPQSQQLISWANKYDPVSNGTRSVSGRRQYIKSELQKYIDDLNNGVYNISDEDKQNELNRINDIINGGDFELGKVAPWLTNLFFTGENYLSPQDIETSKQQQNYQNFLNGIDGYSNPYQTGTQEYEAAEKTRAYNLFDKYQSEYKSDKPKLSFMESEVISDDKIKQSIKNVNINNILINYNKLLSRYRNIKPGDNKTDLINKINKFNKLIYNYYLLNGFEFGKDRYYADWKNGILHVVQKDGKKYHIKQYNLSEAIAKAKQEAPDLYEQLFQSKKQYDSQKSIFKKGGILKASSGDPAPKVNKPKEDDKPDDKPIEGDLGYLEGVLGEETPDDRSIRQFTDPGDYSKEFDINPTDRFITFLENYKTNKGKLINRNIFRVLNAIRGFHASPPMEHYKQYTSKPLEDAERENEARYNQLGALQARSTANSGLAHATQINSRKQITAANNPLKQQQATETRASIDKEIEVGNKNYMYRHEVGEANRKGDVALHNTRLHMLADLLNKNGNIDLKNIAAQQYGLAVNAEKNYTRDLHYAVNTDPVVYSLRNRYQQLIDKGTNLTEDEKKEKSELPSQIRRAQQEVAQRYDATHIAPTGTPYAGFGWRYNLPLNYFYFANGGKMYAAELEKTRRYYMKAFNEMLKHQADHQFKDSRAALAYYRKLFMQSK